MVKKLQKRAKKERTKKEMTEKERRAKETGKELRGIVRVAGRDIKGEMPLETALTKVRGCGIRLARILSGIAYHELKLKSDVLVGELTEDQIEKLESVISNPAKHGIPSYMLNRRKDVETGNDLHLIGTDVTFTAKQDIERDKNMNSWRGFRHQYGQKVRGQRTRSTGRTGMSVGVIRKAIAQKAGAAAAAGAAAQAQTAEKEKATATPSKSEETKA
ncbi:MAG: 30S ribosomal protein S13 [Candidatus Micrarchaeota archaeon]